MGVFYRGRLLIPRGDKKLQLRLLHLAHDDHCHYSGVVRTAQARRWHA